MPVHIQQTLVVVGEVWFVCSSVPQGTQLKDVVVAVVVIVVGEVWYCFQCVGCVSVCLARNPATQLFM